MTLDCGHTYHNYCINQWGMTAGKTASQIGCPLGCHKEPITISDAAPDLSAMSTGDLPQGMAFPVAPAVVFTATAEEDPSGAAQVAEHAVRVSPPSEKQQLQQRALAANPKQRKKRASRLLRRVSTKPAQLQFGLDGRTYAEGESRACRGGGSGTSKGQASRQQTQESLSDPSP